MQVPADRLPRGGYTAARNFDADMQKLVDLVTGEVILSLHRAHRAPLLLGCADCYSASSEMLLAMLDERTHFERRRRGDRDRLDIRFIDSFDRVVEVAAWSFPLHRDALLLFATDPATPPPAWVESYVDLWWRHRCKVEWNEGLHGALDLIDLGVVLLDAEGNVAFANSCAERLLQARDGVRRLGGSLGATAFEDSVYLQTAIGRALESDGVRSEAPLLTLRRAKGRPIVATVVRATKPSLHFCDPAVTVYLLDPDTNVERLLNPVCDAYHLTATEAQLASAIVAGATLAEAAAAQRIRLETARSYLKQIFAKTGTHRQAELVRMMLSGILRAGPAAVARR